jgi:membrane protease YdiL (CAAX protease family)
MYAPKLPFRQVVLWVLCGGIGAQLAGALAAGIMQGFLGSRGAHGAALSASPLVIVPSIVVSGGGLIAVAIMPPQIAGLPLRRALALRGAPPICFGAAALGTVMLGPFADVLMRLMERLLEQFALHLSLGTVPMLNQVVRALPVPLALLAFALLPGVSEELLFRGLLQNAAPGRRLPIVISGVGFALFHVDPQHAAGVLPLGLFLAWVASRCGTLVTMFAHVCNNAAAVFAAHSPTFDVGYGTDQEMPWQWVPISLAFVALCTLTIVRATSTAGTPAHSS